jgi:hypothetical protein
MAYYQTPAGSKVFAAGAFRFGGAILTNSIVRRMMENLWTRLSQP